MVLYIKTIDFFYIMQNSYKNVFKWKRKLFYDIHVKHH